MIYGRKDPNLRLGIGKEFTNILLGRTDELVQDFWPIHDLWLSGIEHLSNLPSN